MESKCKLLGPSDYLSITYKMLTMEANHQYLTNINTQKTHDTKATCLLGVRKVYTQCKLVRPLLWYKTNH
jgi:hypothetical protein